jgi:hypothetical protein
MDSVPAFCSRFGTVTGPIVAFTSRPDPSVSGRPTGSFIGNRSLDYLGEIFLPGSVNPFVHPFVDQEGLTTVVLFTRFTATFV